MDRDSTAAYRALLFAEAGKAVLAECQVAARLGDDVAWMSPAGDAGLIGGDGGAAWVQVDVSGGGVVRVLWVEVGGGVVRVEWLVVGPGSVCVEASTTCQQTSF